MGINEKLQDQLHETFENALISAAPLYGMATKVKMPSEDRGGETVLYRGSLHEEIRPVIFVSDYELLPQGAVSLEMAKDLGTQAGHIVDGLIRIENVKIKGNDPRDILNLRVSNIRSHSEGRSNLEFGFSSFTLPGQEPRDLMFYRFWFAAASINQHYKKS